MQATTTAESLVLARERERERKGGRKEGGEGNEDYATLTHTIGITSSSMAVPWLPGNGERERERERERETEREEVSGWY